MEDMMKSCHAFKSNQKNVRESRRVHVRGFFLATCRPLGRVSISLDVSGGLRSRASEALFWRSELHRTRARWRHESLLRQLGAGSAVARFDRFSLELQVLRVHVTHAIRGWAVSTGYIFCRWLPVRAPKRTRNSSLFPSNWSRGNILIAFVASCSV